MAVLAGLRLKTRFWWPIHEDRPRTYHEFLNRVEKYISAEEATSDQEEVGYEIDLSDTVKEKKPSRSPQLERKKDKREREHPRAHAYKFWEYQPLKASLEEVFTQANMKEAFRRSIILNDRQAGQRQGRYCRYHRTMGHDTDNCRDLKEEVESLIRRGRLQEFVSKLKEADRPTTRQPLLQGAPTRAQQAIPNRNPPSHAKIKMMVVKNQYIEGSRRARLRQARSAKIVPNYWNLTPKTGIDLESFWFTEEDSEGILQDQSDALVVTMMVAGVKVHRTLLDNGSSVNILYSRTLRQLETSIRYLQPYPRKLQGFSRDPIEALGQIFLIMELGEAPHQRRILVDFVVVDLPSNYNAILGRPILHELKAATSIYHYCVIFSTPYGIGIIQGDQATAMACNIDLPRPQVNMLKSRTNTQAEEARPKRPIIANLSEIGITEKNLKESHR
ncbi:uncharacterized protein LOC111394222 [Olea europaea var. sylvestris]|uniref:uncharacterized protein LOC111394222 n=1 Tax=Olea europaea var. sylvestris TaxID=158386 RepID=UPI000C1D8867|nr:uncharacterized protein LOC111394222 [Olea europaea var. sylvestris]